MSLVAHAPRQQRGPGMVVSRPGTTGPGPRGRASGDFAILGKAGPLLTADQERALAGRVAEGDEGARDDLVRANLRLVVTIARGYHGRGIDPEDLVSEGCVGLIAAAERFDPRFNTRFSTYAAWWIKHAIGVALGNTAAMIRLPMHAHKLLGKWRRTAGLLERTLGREPRFDEVADALDLPEGKRRIVGQALRTRRRADSGGMPPEMAANPEEPLAESEAAEARDELRRRLERLSPKERTVIRLRYGLGGGGPLTLKEAGRRIGCTREWVRKIEIRALGKLS
jgi:RNA polymerase primary sigma factor